MPAKRFCLRLSLFFLPLTLVGLVGAGIPLLCGELLPVKFVAWLQMKGKPFIFLPQLSDHSYRFKLEAVRRHQPAVVALGSSRANQWRSAMFRPATFYNGANAIFAMRDFPTVLEEYGDFAPRVVIFSIDYFTFVPAFDSVYRNQSHEELAGWGSAEQLQIMGGVFAEMRQNPRIVFDPRHDGMPALGLYAIKSGVGFRLDGSYNYGFRAPVDPKSAVAEIQVGTQWPVPPAERLDDDLRRRLEQFTELARQKGIALVGVTMPFVPEVTDAMEQSPLYGAWRQFEAQQTKEWIRNQGVIYFDFTRLESFGGKPDEFADPFHPSEPAYIRMLIAMLAEPKFRALFPDIDINNLRDHLKHASAIEAYGNEF